MFKTFSKDNVKAIGFDVIKKEVAAAMNYGIESADSFHDYVAGVVTAINAIVEEFGEDKQ